MATRAFGDVLVGVYDAGRVIPHYPLASDWLTPDQDVDADGHALMGVNGMTVRIGDAAIVIDPLMLHGENDIEPLARSVAGPSLDANLEALGIDPEEVTHVLITHGHTDHLSGTLHDDGRLRFPQAEHFFPEADWRDYVTDAPAWPAGHLYARIPGLIEPVERAGLLRLVSGDLEVAPGVRLISAPGETAGHQVVKVDTADRPVLYLGDLVHYPVELSRPSLALAGRDPDVLKAGRLRVLGDAATTNAAVMYTHSRFPGWGRVEQVTPETFRWHYD